MGFRAGSAPVRDFSAPDEVSSLYCIPPYHPDDSFRESLTSLMIRTARAHAISPRDMIWHVLGQRFKEVGAICKGTFFRHYSAPINGLGRYARLFTHVFAQLAAHPDLSPLTTLPLSETIAAQGSPVIHHGPRWCPLCFAAMLENGMDVYRPLLWALAPVGHCHTHGIRLEERCPHCGETQPVIPRWPDMAFCDFCRGTLFDSYEPLRHLVPDSPVEHRQVWNLGACVDLVTHLHEIDIQIAPQSLKIVLEMAIIQLCNGNRAEFCRQIGLSIYAFGKILRDENKPTLETLLRIGYVLNLLPSQLLIRNKHPAPEALHLVRRIQSQKRSWERNSAIEKDAVVWHLRSALPPPVREIATSISMTRGGLKYRHPETYSSIVGKRRTELARHTQLRADERKDYLRDCVAQIVATGRFPSKDLVEKSLRQKGWSLLRPELRQRYHEMLIELEGNDLAD